MYAGCGTQFQSCFFSGEEGRRGEEGAPGVGQVVGQVRLAKSNLEAKEAPFFYVHPLMYKFPG